MSQNSSVSNRSTVDVFHFALCAFGFFFGVGGVVVSSIPVALCGFLAIAWGLLYFAVSAD